MCGAAVAVYAGKIWVMGGYEDGHISASVCIYDAEADAWHTAPPLPSPCSGSAVTINGGISLFHRHGCFVYGAETQHGPGWRKLGAGVGRERGDIGREYRVCGPIVLG